MDSIARVTPSRRPLNPAKKPAFARPGAQRSLIELIAETISNSESVSTTALALETLVSLGDEREGLAAAERGRCSVESGCSK